MKITQIINKIKSTCEVPIKDLLNTIKQENYKSSLNSSVWLYKLVLICISHVVDENCQELRDRLIARKGHCASWRNYRLNFLTDIKNMSYVQNMKQTCGLKTIELRNYYVSFYEYIFFQSPMSWWMLEKSPSSFYDLVRPPEMMEWLRKCY